MTEGLQGVIPLSTGGASAVGPVDIAVQGRPDRLDRALAQAPPRRRLALPALANAHDHCRPLSPTSFGARRQAAGDLAAAAGGDAGGRSLSRRARRIRARGARRRGIGDGALHALHGPMPSVDEMREVARAARDVGVRVTLALFMRDRNPLVYGARAEVLAALDPASRAARGSRVPARRCRAPRSRSRASKPIAAAVESPTFSVQFGPNGPQWCSDELLAAIAEASQRTGRRVHMHLLETRYQRAFADAAYPEGVVARLERARPAVAAPDARALRLRARRGPRRDRARAASIIATNPSSNLHLRSAIAPIGEAMRRGCRVALGVDASAFDEDDDILREMRLGHFLHGGWGFERIVERAHWLAGIVANGRFANGAPGTGALEVGEPARYAGARPRRARPRRGHAGRADRPAVRPRDAARMSTRSTSPGAGSSASGKLAERRSRCERRRKLRAQYRERMPSRAPFPRRPGSRFAPAVAGFTEAVGCC